MLVRELMSAAPVRLEAEEPVAAAARLMRERNIGALPVCDAEGKLVGMLTDRDIVTRCVAFGSDAARLRVEEIMTRGVVTAEALSRITSNICRR